MRKCDHCGKNIHKPYKLCWQCDARKKERELRKPDRAYDLETYYNTLCDMCGKEGAHPRRTGRNFCSGCWQIENS